MLAKLAGERAKYLLRLMGGVKIVAHQEGDHHRCTIKWESGTETLPMFFNCLTNNWKTCKRWNVTILEEDIDNHAVRQIYKANRFEMKVMNDWERKKPPQNRLKRVQPKWQKRKKMYPTSM